MSFHWQIRLLGTLRVESGQESITRFRSQKFGVLLAYLALFPRRSHSREELADLLWPDADSEIGRVNLRTALASLRRQLEPPGSPAGSVLQAEGRSQIRLNPETVSTDVAEFEAALLLAARTEGAETIRHLTRAVQFYNGPLLPGCYEDWALSERDRLADAYLRALHQLVTLTRNEGDHDQSLDFARRAVSADPLREESYADVIRLLMESGQSTAAQRQFDEMARLFRDKLDISPSPEIQALLKIKAEPRPTPKVVVPLPSPERLVPPPAVMDTMPETRSSTGAFHEEAIPQNLPLMLSRFFGREEEIDALRRLLTDTARLITVTGPGGSGKTRIVAETARRLGKDFRGGIWFVPLADIRDPERIVDAAAEALGINRSAANGASLLTPVTDALRAASHPVLLIFDNFEQVAEEGAALVVELLTRVPSLTCLVTSRQRLRVESEGEFPLLPLPVPEHRGTPERLLEFSSVQLFVARAQAARPDFQLTARNSAAVTALCARLEGIPLAIELAAAWAEALTPAQMLARMEHRLDLLVSRRRDVSTRHRTLRAAIEGSVTLLPPEARSFFANLSVFRGGWTLEAAENVCAEPFAMEHLTTLRDHSLILGVSGTEGAIRFRMLDTLREFAREMREGAEPEETQIETRHADFFTRLAEEAIPHLNLSDQAEWLRILNADHDNLRAALDFRVKQNDITAALALAGLLTTFWVTRGYASEGRQRLTALLELADSAGDSVPALVRARALGGAGKLAHIQSDYAASQPCHEAALALFRAEGDTRGIASSLAELANGEMQQSNYAAATTLYEESLAGYRALGDKRGIALLLNNLGANSLAKGLPNVAREYLEESLPLSRELGHHRVRAIALLNLASIWQAEGDFERARACLEECLAVRRELGDVAGAGRALEGLGRMARDEGDADTALRCFEESLVLQRQVEDNDAVASIRLFQGLVLVELKHDLENGWKSLQESLILSLQVGNKNHFVNLLNALATVAVAQNQRERAVHLWSVASVQRDALGITARQKDAIEREAEIDAVRAALGEEAFEAAWDKGSRLSHDDTVALASENLTFPATASREATPVH